MSLFCYGLGVKRYKLWNPKTRKNFMSRSIIFNESMMFNDSLSSDHVLESHEMKLQYTSAGGACG